VRALGWVGQAQRAITDSDEVTERTRSKHRVGIASEASGQCKVVAKCERTSQATTKHGYGSASPGANDGGKDGQNVATMLSINTSPFWRYEATKTKP